MKVFSMLQYMGVKHLIADPSKIQLLIKFQSLAFFMISEQSFNPILIIIVLSLYYFD